MSCKKYEKDDAQLCSCSKCKCGESSEEVVSVNPLREYDKPDYPTHAAAGIDEDLLKNVPKRWEHNAKIASYITLVVSGSIPLINYTAAPPHGGGSGGGGSAVYVPHWTESLVPLAMIGIVSSIALISAFDASNSKKPNKKYAATFFYHIFILLNIYMCFIIYTQLWTGLEFVMLLAYLSLIIASLYKYFIKKSLVAAFLIVSVPFSFFILIFFIMDFLRFMRF